jgi:hypothetical protein
MSEHNEISRRKFLQTAAAAPFAASAVWAMVAGPIPPSTDPPTTVPEPSALSLMLSPLALLALRGVRRARR